MSKIFSLVRLVLSNGILKKISGIITGSGIITFMVDVLRWVFNMVTSDIFIYKVIKLIPTVIIYILIFDLLPVMGNEVETYIIIFLVFNALVVLDDGCTHCIYRKRVKELNDLYGTHIKEKEGYGKD